MEFIETPTGHDAHLEEPELMTTIIHRRMPTD
jgi:hypothetical protein